MNWKIVIILLAVFGRIEVTAQTNTNQVAQAPKTNAVVKRTAPITYVQPALPPGYAMLVSISNQIAGIEKKLKEAEEKAATEEKRHELQFKAGQGSDQLTITHVKWRENWRKTQIEPLKKQIGALRLKEFEICQQYKIPDPKDAKKKR